MEKKPEPEPEPKPEAKPFKIEIKKKEKIELPPEPEEKDNKPEDMFKLRKKSSVPRKETPKKEEEAPAPFAMKLKKSSQVKRSWDDDKMETVELKHHEFEKLPLEETLERTSTVIMSEPIPDKDSIEKQKKEKSKKKKKASKTFRIIIIGWVVTLFLYFQKSKDDAPDGEEEVSHQKKHLFGETTMRQWLFCRLNVKRKQLHLILSQRLSSLTHLKTM